ncbi:hypothetical protein KY285_030640 [Solanum tuberosum]|nr:hypothetical protein KY285_030640 [Solanum tuberosum]
MPHLTGPLTAQFNQRSTQVDRQHQNNNRTNQSGGNWSGHQNNPNSGRNNNQQNSNNNWRSRNSNNRARVQCQLCDKYGHIARVCRSWSHNMDEQQANFPSTTGSTNPDWVMDTGASHHITSHTQNLQSYSEYTGRDDVIVGDGNGFENTSTSGSRPE